MEEELEAALGAARSARVGETRAGYRHGTRSRTLTTSLGPTTSTMPRARLATQDGGTTEWASVAVPRYQRRTARVERDLDAFLAYSNLDRSHQGYRLRGRTPAQALREALGVTELPSLNFLPAQEDTEGSDPLAA